eukprot:SAG22_NODE_241_length_14126_cov_9.747202_4_plen_122_part_00
MALHDALALAQCVAAAAAAEDGVGGTAALLETALAEFLRRRAPEHRRCALSSRHYGRLRTGMAPEASGFGVRSWAQVSPDAYRRAVLASGVQRPIQSELMPTADPGLQVRYKSAGGRGERL